MHLQPQAFKAPSPHKRRKAQRPGEILEAALELFLARGYAATRLEDVAALAGVTKGTVYNYFDSKEQLFLSVIESNTQCQLDGAMAMVKNHHGSMESLIRILLAAWWDSVLSKTTGSLLKIVISESAQFPAIAQFYLDSVINPLQAILADLVRKGIAACEFRAIDAQAVSQVALDNLLMLALRRVTFSDGSNAPHFAQAIDTTLDVCLCGLIRPPAP
jgi:AcrR family transcriptional regulator